MEGLLKVCEGSIVSLYHYSSILIQMYCQVSVLWVFVWVLIHAQLSASTDSMFGVIWEQCAGSCVPCSWAFYVEEQVCGDGFALAVWTIFKQCLWGFLLYFELVMLSALLRLDDIRCLGGRKRCELQSPLLLLPWLCRLHFYSLQVLVLIMMEVGMATALFCYFKLLCSSIPVVCQETFGQVFLQSL